MKTYNKKIKCGYKIKDYFEYNRKNSISITRIVSLVLFGVIVFNIGKSILEIKNIQNYIEGNSNTHTMLINSKEELQSMEKAKDAEDINMGNVRKIFEVVGVENIDSLHVNRNFANVVGRAKDMKTVEILMKNKILAGAHIKRIEGGQRYTFEIESGGAL